MKKISVLFSVIVFCACLISSIIAALVNDYEKATYFLILAYLTGKGFE